MRIIYAVMMIVGFALLLWSINNSMPVYADAEDIHVDWTGGNVAVAFGDQWMTSVGWLPGLEVGLRDDGVLVWREIGDE